MFRVARPPISLPTGDVFDLVVGVQAEPGELENREPARESGGVTYRIWTEVEHFGAPPGPEAEAHLYTVDRAEGVIMFAPAAQIADDRRTGGLDGAARRARRGAAARVGGSSRGTATAAGRTATSRRARSRP